MGYRDFDEFLIRLEQAHNVVVHGSATRAGGRGATVPVYVRTENATGALFVRDAFATRTRLAWALQVEHVADIATRLSKLLDLSKPYSFSMLMERASDLLSSLRFNAPSGRRLKTDLAETAPERLSAVLYACESPVVGTVFPNRDGRPYWGVQIGPDRDRTHLDILSPMDLSVGEAVAVTLGGDPASLVAAFIPLPNGIHRSYFTGWLRNRPGETLRLDTVPVEVPANVEAVIEGVVTSIASIDDGPPSPERIRHRARVRMDRVMLKSKPVLVSLSNRDVDVLRDAVIDICLPLVRLMAPELVAVQMRNGVALLTVATRSQTSQLRSAYAVLASPFAEGVKWMIVRNDAHVGGRANHLPLIADVTRVLVATHPETGHRIPVFGTGDVWTQDEEDIGWHVDYERAGDAWQSGERSLED